AVAVFEGNGNAARVVAATRPARRAGIQAGMTLPQARALLPDLLARGRDRESERAAQETLAEVAETFSPRVESAGDGVVYFDAAGISLPPKSELPLPARGERVGVRGKGAAPPEAALSAFPASLPGREFFYHRRPSRCRGSVLSATTGNLVAPRQGISADCRELVQGIQRRLRLRNRTPPGLTQIPHSRRKPGSTGPAP
ncbi:MAG TPA: hypothetical protein VGQ90_01275, partial [Stellaceae bacterium]|nr:hypothetical protein [Stellaceae bacterium]